MKNLILLLFILSISQNIRSQNCEDLKFREYESTFPIWKELDINKQKLFYSDGSIKTEYVDLPKNRKLRIDYFNEGYRRYTAEVKQELTIDSSYVKDKTTGEVVLKIDSGYKDVFHGKYVEYFEPEFAYNDKTKSFGQFTDGIMTGEWKTERANQYIVIANFNKSGKLEGAYNEYYIAKGNRIGNIHWNGQYGIEIVTAVVFDYDRNRFVEKKLESSVRIGSWTEYTIAGTLIQTITYNWEP